MTAPKPALVRKVINMLFACTEGERLAALERLTAMKDNLPHNTILSDYIAGKAPPAHDEAALRAEVARLRADLSTARVECKSAKTQGEYHRSLAVALERCRETLTVKLREAEDEVEALRRAERNRGDDQRSGWDEDDTATLRQLYVDVVEKYREASRTRRQRAWEDMCADYNADERETVWRSPMALKKRLAEMRKTDPSLPHLFPEYTGKAG